MIKICNDNLIQLWRLFQTFIVVLFITCLVYVNICTNKILFCFFQTVSHGQLSVLTVDRLTVPSVLAACAALQDLRGNVCLALLGPQPLGLAAVGGVSEVGFCIFFKDFFCIFFMCIFSSDVGIHTHKSSRCSCWINRNRIFFLTTFRLF